MHAYRRDDNMATIIPSEVYRKFGDRKMNLLKNSSKTADYADCADNSIGG